MSSMSPNRLPDWLRKRGTSSVILHSMKKRLRTHGLHTVCEEAKCPNIGECFERGTATFMVMGDTCTRRCGFCAVASGEPIALDSSEPERVAKQILEMKLVHAVVTSVTRDDLDDGGAKHFAETIRAIRKISSKTTVEVLTPDFNGIELNIKTVCDASPDIFNHNVETVERLTPKVRDRASFACSISVLKTARRLLPNRIIKSGLMVGLGETEDELKQTLCTLKDAGCDAVTIGQYLRPSKDALAVVEYLKPEKFEELKLYGESIGIKFVVAAPLVRSSYMADLHCHCEEARGRRGNPGN